MGKLVGFGGGGGACSEKSLFEGEAAQSKSKRKGERKRAGGKLFLRGAMRNKLKSWGGVIQFANDTSSNSTGIPPPPSHGVYTGYCIP